MPDVDMARQSWLLGFVEALTFNFSCTDDSGVCLPLTMLSSSDEHLFEKVPSSSSFENFSESILECMRHVEASSRL